MLNENNGKFNNQRTSTEFLTEGGREYAYKANGKISPTLLSETIVKAEKMGDMMVAQRARNLYEEHCA